MPELFIWLKGCHWSTHFFHPPPSFVTIADYGDHQLDRLGPAHLVLSKFLLFVLNFLLLLLAVLFVLSLRIYFSFILFSFTMAISDCAVLHIAYAIGSITNIHMHMLSSEFCLVTLFASGMKYSNCPFQSKVMQSAWPGSLRFTGWQIIKTNTKRVQHVHSGSRVHLFLSMLFLSRQFLSTSTLHRVLFSFLEWAIARQTKKYSHCLF